MNKAEWRVYNREKQKEYRRKRGLKKTWSHGESFYAPKCSFCGMLLGSDYHKLHPLIGCQKAAQKA